MTLPASHFQVHYHCPHCTGLPFGITYAMRTPIASPVDMRAHSLLNGYQRDWILFLQHYRGSIDQGQCQRSCHYSSLWLASFHVVIFAPLCCPFHITEDRHWMSAWANHPARTGNETLRIWIQSMTVWLPQPGLQVPQACGKRSRIRVQ